MFKSTFKLFFLFLISALCVYAHGNVSVVTIVLFNYEVQINLFLFMLTNFIFVKLTLNIYLILSYISSKFHFRSKIKK